MYNLVLYWVKKYIVFIDYALMIGNLPWGNSETDEKTEKIILIAKAEKFIKNNIKSYHLPDSITSILSRTSVAASALKPFFLKILNMRISSVFSSVPVS